MINRNAFLIAAPVVAVLFLLLVVPSQGWSKEVAKGVTVDLVAEYPVDVPGIEKVLLQKLTMAPGSVLEGTVIGITFCNTTRGSISVVDHTNGTSTIYTVGSRWAPEEGIKFTLTNPGDVTHVHWIYRLVRKT